MMRRLLFFAAISLCTFSTASADAAAEVVMYGAKWCGPCRTVKAFLTQRGVKFSYRDIDEASGRSQYERARGGLRGIPLTIVGREKIVGANLETIWKSLTGAGAAKGPVAARGQKTYGGHAPEWWQRQFRQLRQQLARMTNAATHAKKNAYDNLQQERAERLAGNVVILKASLNEMENEASKVSLPRKYRK